MPIRNTGARYENVILEHQLARSSNPRPTTAATRTGAACSAFGTPLLASAPAPDAAAAPARADTPLRDAWLDVESPAPCRGLAVVGMPCADSASVDMAPCAAIRQPCQAGSRPLEDPPRLHRERAPRQCTSLVCLTALVHYPCAGSCGKSRTLSPTPTRQPRNAPIIAQRQSVVTVLTPVYAPKSLSMQGVLPLGSPIIAVEVEWHTKRTSAHRPWQQTGQCNPHTGRISRGATPQAPNTTPTHPHSRPPHLRARAFRPCPRPFVPAAIASGAGGAPVCLREHRP